MTVLITRKQEGQWGSRKWEGRQRKMWYDNRCTDWSHLLRRWRKEATSQAMQTNRGRKNRQMDSPLRASRSSQPGWHLDLSPMKVSSDFWPPELQRINLCCLKPLCLWQRVTAAIGNTTPCSVLSVPAALACLTLTTHIMHALRCLRCLTAIRAACNVLSHPPTFLSPSSPHFLGQVLFTHLGHSHYRKESTDPHTYIHLGGVSTLSLAPMIPFTYL